VTTPTGTGTTPTVPITPTVPPIKLPQVGQMVPSGLVSTNFFLPGSNPLIGNVSPDGQYTSALLNYYYYNYSINQCQHISSALSNTVQWLLYMDPTSVYNTPYQPVSVNIQAASISNSGQQTCKNNLFPYVLPKSSNPVTWIDSTKAGSNETNKLYLLYNSCGITLTLQNQAATKGYSVVIPIGNGDPTSQFVILYMYSPTGVQVLWVDQPTLKITQSNNFTITSAS
jgi:hypothetical protein